MVKITHYEVYTDRGDGWKLAGRFASDQRYEAINLSKEKEQEKLKVKIIREIFDVQDNSYSESVEYIGGLSSPRRNSDPLSPQNIGGRSNALSALPEEGTGDAQKRKSSIFSAVLKLISIIVICLLFSNVLVTLVHPLIEDFVPESRVNIALFLIFIVSFMSMVVPLILKKVPWYVFDFAGGGRKRVKERKFFSKAENIIKLYHLNEDYEISVAPAYPEAPLEHKRYIVSFLHEVLSKLDSQSIYNDSFSKLGVKLIVYGGCLELSKYSGFTISEANSLLYEAFKIIDGERPDLEDFYDAKKTFNDNKVAIFLTGVGAYLMAQVIDERPMDGNILQETFDKWENLVANYQKIYPEEEVEAVAADTDAPQVTNCLVNVQNLLKFFDDNLPDLDKLRLRYEADIRNIISNVNGKYKGDNIIEKDTVTSIEFSSIAAAVGFAVEFIGDISEYRDELNDDNLIFLSKCSLVDRPEEEAANLDDYIKDVLEHTYNNEILVTEKIKNSIHDEKYSFEFLGEKNLNKSAHLVPLYKLVY